MDGVHEIHRPFPDTGRPGITVLVTDKVDNTFKIQCIGRCNTQILLLDRIVLIGAIQNGRNGFIRNVLNGGVKVKSVFFANGFHLVEDPVVLVFANWCNATFFNALLRVGKNLVQVDFSHCTKPIAFRTCSVWRIERKSIGFRLTVRDARSRAHQCFAEVFQVPCFMVKDHDRSFTIFHSQLDGLDQTLA